MIQPYLFKAPQISAGFRYPQAFLDFCASADEQSIIPWYVLDTEREANIWLRFLREQYPTRNLIPFIRHTITTDDLCCFDGDDTSGNSRVFFVHTFTSPGWEDRGYVADFPVWLEYAAEDHAEYLREMSEDGDEDGQPAAEGNRPE